MVGENRGRAQWSGEEPGLTRLGGRWGGDKTTAPAGARPTAPVKARAPASTNDPGQSSSLGDSPGAGTRVEIAASCNRPILRGPNACGAIIGHDQVDRGV